MIDYSDPIKNMLISATRQFRHNDDNSPDMSNPEQGFVIAYDRDAVDEIITTLRQQLADSEARVAELKHLAGRLQHCAQGFYLDQGDYGHMEAIMKDYHAIMRGDATHPTGSGQGESQ